jgi:peptide deformylase
LSLPGINATVKRNKSVKINAYGMDGTEINAEVDGFLARIIQHELDHLDGVLFIDRVPEQNRMQIQDELSGFESTFETKRKAGLILSDEKIFEELKAWESKYC